MTIESPWRHRVRQWSHPPYYVGATWEGWYCAGFGQSRDSDTLEASNFAVASRELRKLATELPDGEDGVQIVRESHWAVGWVEWIAIHESNLAALEVARELCQRANDYPILDEEEHSCREWEECEQVWRSFDAGDRLRYFRNHSYRASSLAELLQAIRAGSWYAAANLLNCPSDLLY